MRLPASEKLEIIHLVENSASAGPTNAGDARHQAVDILSLV